MFCSCQNETRYPQELVMADSAFMTGHHHIGDSILSCYAQRLSDDDETNHYYQLMLLEQGYMHGNLNELRYHTADSLVHYYENVNKEKYAKALLFTAQIYYESEDFPTANLYYRRALDESKSCNNLRLQYLIYGAIGRMYCDQRLFEECIPCYQKYYYLSTCFKDTLRMGFSSFNMGIVHTIKNNYDSIVHYYTQALGLLKDIPEGVDNIPIITSNLCDVYIQTEQWDKALTIMPRDSLNDANWAYWHLGQEHVDSAIYYFQRTLGRYKWQGEVEVLHLLGNLERERGNTAAALDYYDRMAVAEDSLRQQQNTEETIHANARYNFNAIRQQRDAMEQEAKDLRYIFIITGLTVILLVPVVWLLFMRYKSRKESELAQQRQLTAEAEERGKKGQQQMEYNSMRIAELEGKLADALQRNDELEAQRIKTETQVLRLQNEALAANQTRSEILFREFVKSPLYEKLKSPTLTEPRTMTEEEWMLLQMTMDDIYDRFTYRLNSLHSMSDIEMRICYLLKLKVPLADIAEIVCRSKSAITLARTRLYRKLTGEKGSSKACAEKLDQMIQEF